jgi:hypothetical protein
MNPGAGPVHRDGLALFPTGVVVFATVGPSRLDFTVGPSRLDFDRVADVAGTLLPERRVRQRRSRRGSGAHFSPVEWLLGR